MIKLDTNRSLTAMTPEITAQPGGIHRFILPIRDIDTDLASVTRRVEQLARAAGARILLLGLCEDPLEEMVMRRSLSTFSAVINNGAVPAEAEVIVGRDVASIVKSRWQPGDMVVCLEEQPSAFRHKTLKQILSQDPDMPLYILSGSRSHAAARPAWLFQAAAWVGSLAIIFGFLVLQARIPAWSGSLAPALQLISLPIEVFLIMAWNSLLG